MITNSREGIEWYKKYKEQFGWSDNYCLDDPQIEFFHQELQKARHDWLREEIVKLKSMYRYERSMSASMYDQALDELIQRYQSELDQPNQ